MTGILVLLADLKFNFFHVIIKIGLKPDLKILIIYFDIE
jgi:hypothetical protein